MNTLETDVTVVGSGPAGSTMALALASYGIKVTFISRYRWTSPTLRAHITNQRTMEILRDFGIEQEALADASPQSQMANTVFCTSLAGQELGRVQPWGNHPARLAEYTMFSTTSMCDLPQTYMEPLLVSNALKRGADVRFNTFFQPFVETSDGISVQAEDRLTGAPFDIRAKYLVGADGGNSLVAEQAGLSFEGAMGIVGSTNIEFEADLSALTVHRPSVLYCVIQPGSDVGGVGMGFLRMVRPWNKWLIVYGYDFDAGPPEMMDDYATGIIRSLTGLPDLAPKITGTSLWTVNNYWETELSKGCVFCVGDAVHRHPPTNGLGSNTSMQDSYNLAWKLALVLKGTAAPALLDSYNAERAPVAAQIVSRAIRSIQEYGPIFGALGLGPDVDKDATTESIAQLSDASAKAHERREAFRNELDAKSYEYNAHGVEMNQRYVSGAVIPDRIPNSSTRDAELFHIPTTSPGAKLPHAWLEDKTNLLSTLDLVGQEEFTLLTGIEGEACVDAADTLAKRHKLPLSAYMIGRGQQYQDLYGDWQQLREVREVGCILVRPDGYVAWRSTGIASRPDEALSAVLGEVLSQPTFVSTHEAA
ncbi:putative 3-[3-hydroxy-phenyl]propionate/3-hydroxycinnamic acid hydroxylase [Octadecabacter antarcticus 307]|uniref:Putative 3-[3-hydroxy-phenyl]propionate/3-hydroxycinnamic acid hydroxylase n=1 Tax=Octadecabacter antarcticus 307 TaxID=391626 RepID=M9R7L7_9RHOB|nr:FAD-dependent monooxygenase [Octadecabacter antarcticus]AGI68654.1 putative 3-[3-hydroxy-phenyl]propionate/3-hydroxycinnamic acid hydroxylase [Octadecabacter antarcticus 307]